MNTKSMEITGKNSVDMNVKEGYTVAIVYPKKER
jgi:hypothetical protein